MRKLLLAGVAMTMLSGGAALAQPYDIPPGADPDGYYSRSDHDGYYDRRGQYHRFDEYRDRDYDRGDRGGYYREGQYEDNCRQGNTAAMNGVMATTTATSRRSASFIAAARSAGPGRRLPMPVAAATPARARPAARMTATGISTTDF